MASLAQMDYCKSKNYDPEDPRCAKIFLTGRYVKVIKINTALVNEKKTVINFQVNETSDEYTFARNALFSRHPAMASWPKGTVLYTYIKPS